MNKFCYLLLISLGVTVMQVQAQESSQSPTKTQGASGNTENQRYTLTQKKVTFAVQPLQLINNGLRYDIEIRLGKGPGWLQIGPAFYFLKDNDGNYPNYYYEGKTFYRNWYSFHWREPYSELKGAGLDLNYKHFLDARRSFYIAAGLSYTRYNIKYWAKVWKDYVEDGLKYYEYGEDYNTQKINKFGINTFVGYQIPTRSAFLFDVFGGYAVRYSFADDDKPPFDNSIFSYGYSGIVALTGFRIGFGVR